MTLKKIIEDNHCIGCGLCKSISPAQINFSENSHGFLEPSLLENLPHNAEAFISEFCPGSNIDISLAPENKEDYMWGRIKKIGKAYSTSSNTRLAGSSGGVITEISAYLLAKGIVDSVYHLKSPDEGPFTFTPGISNSDDEIKKSVGSKYTASPTLLRINELLESESTKKWAVVAKPCEISAARRMVRSAKHLDENNFVFISFFCAGLPSISANKKLSSKIGIPPEDVSSIIYRGNGCPGNTIITSNTGRQASTTYKEAWGNTLGRDIHPRCKICPDGIGLDADLVCADAWDMDDSGYPSFSENEGFSLVISRTNKASAFLNGMIADDKISWAPYESSNIQYAQPSQFYRRTTLVSRILALKFLMKSPPKILGTGVSKIIFAAGLLTNIKAFAGMVKRQWRL
ncbi:Coenzyme F420 hydrogenase/dehydrogenase, beta subunit C-terminal domain [Pseudomonas sp. ACN5]|jgi:coenzyme F420 hydrogenase subunit beta|uniref:Coenzyme F420 hydrogenase/dehydrogenase, beta subunit C-terminal domain n=1 Tax=Pseudomonas sp. ACN5 TaxID=1920427 RepID=UPI000BB2FD23|nr:Coenzyme F420 hydrogenase/dehydrogenase, beta subunit C-terminal domain [Pseudomonas sp. ACN5]PBJ06970.1 coenzyme F420-reducing hydrogenase subunit beta [Pseudomonas sp. ACN5]